MTTTDDSTTYATLLTPAGVGAISLVRVWGPDAFRMLNACFVPAAGSLSSEPYANRLRYGRWLDAPRAVTGEGDRQAPEAIDDVVIAAGRDASGRLLVDINTHGGTRIIERVLLSLQSLGARVLPEAPPASQVWHAANTIEAEALDVLVRASTERAVRFVSYQRQHLTAYLRRVAALGLESAEAAQSALRKLLGEAAGWKRLVDGAVIVIAGPPNAGKSTLANRLLERAHALVSDLPGTTRDWVAEPAAIHGVPVTIIDTAGLRAAHDVIEAEGIRRGQEQLGRADLCLFVLDRADSAGLAEIDRHLAAHPRVATLVVANKADLKSHSTEIAPLLSLNPHDISALTGLGMQALKEGILAELGLGTQEQLIPGLFTNRQLAIAAGLLNTAGIDGFDLAACIENDLIGVERRPYRP